LIIHQFPVRTIPLLRSRSRDLSSTTFDSLEVVDQPRFMLLLSSWNLGRVFDFGFALLDQGLLVHADLVYLHLKALDDLQLQDGKRILRNFQRAREAFFQALHSCRRGDDFTVVESFFGEVTSRLALITTAKVYAPLVTVHSMSDSFYQPTPAIVDGDALPTASRPFEISDALRGILNVRDSSDVVV